MFPHPAQVIVVAFGTAGVVGTLLLMLPSSRSKYGITIVGVKRAGQDFTHATPDAVVEEGDLIIVSGPQEKMERFSELI